MTIENPLRSRWHHKLGAMLFILFCFELGLMLITLPWMNAWDLNWFATVSPRLRGIWMNTYFRGGLSGIGVLNIVIAISETLRMRRPAQRT